MDRNSIFKEFQGNIQLIGVLVVLGVCLFGCLSCAYALPILSSYWKSDE